MQEGKFIDMLRGAELGFYSERSESESEGGLSEEVKNREGVASGGATLNYYCTNA